MTPSAMTAVLGVLLILGGTALSVSTCNRSARAVQRPTDVRTLGGLLAAWVLACSGASLIAASADTGPTILALAVGAAGVTAPVVLGLVTALRGDREDLT